MDNLSNLKIIYPYPMKLSYGYSYMLSILQFLNALSELFEVEILSLDSTEELERYFKDILGIKKNKFLSVRTISNKFLGIKSNKLFFFRNAKKYIKKNLKTNNIIFYSRDFKQIKLSYKAFKNYPNVKFIFEVHQILSENYKRRGDLKNSTKMKELESYVFKNVDILISITKTLQSDIRKNFYLEKPKLVILPVGFNKDYLSARESKKDIDIIYTGNFSEWKGLDILIEAISIYKIQYSRKIHVKLIGARPNDMNKYKAMINKFDVDDYVEIIPRVSHKEILSYLSRSVIGVLPNKFLDDGIFYTSPLKLYEYLGVGLKVIVSRLPSIQSNIDESLVYFFEPENPDDLALKIHNAILDSNFEKSKVQNFASNYTWEERAEKFRNFIYENINYKI